ncbi:hypothetical protein [Flavobacterium sp.]
MGKQKGIVALVGTFGELNFYIRKGKPVVRAAGGGFVGEKIKNSAGMARVRENGSEFGMVSSFKKTFKNLLFPFFGTYADSSLHGRLMRLFQDVKVCDVVSARGLRIVGKGLASVEGSNLLRQFAFTEKPISAFMTGDLVFNPLDYSLSVNEFDAKKICFPLSTSVMELQFGVLTFDASHLPSEVFMSAPQFFDAGSSVTNFVMHPMVVPTGTSLKIGVVGLRFYEELNGQRYLMRSLNCQSIAVL